MRRGLARAEAVSAAEESEWCRRVWLCLPPARRARGATRLDQTRLASHPQLSPYAMSPIVIARAEDPLPVCTPYLMPFHIDYSGPAPISTYFRVKPAPPPGYLGKTESLNSILDTTQSSQCSAGSQVSTTSDATLVASSPSATLGSQGGGSSQVSCGFKSRLEHRNL